MINHYHSDTVKAIEARLKDTDAIISWGCFRRTTGRRLNSADAIKVSTNKPLARLIMGRSGLSVPVTASMHSEFPIISRPAKTSRGSNVHVARNESELREIPRGWHSMEYYPKTRELRVHVLFGKVLFISDKNYDKKYVEANQAVTQESWRILKWDEFDPMICSVAVKAVRSLGLDFGAVDVMTDPEDPLLPPYCICEVNTAPTLANSPTGLDKYSKFINAWIDGTLNIEYKYYKKGRSWAWKNKDINANT